MHLENVPSHCNIWQSYQREMFFQSYLTFIWFKSISKVYSVVTDWMIINPHSLTCISICPSSELPIDFDRREQQHDDTIIKAEHSSSLGAETEGSRWGMLREAVKNPVRVVRFAFGVVARRSAFSYNWYFWGWIAWEFYMGNIKTLFANDMLNLRKKADIGCCTHCRFGFRWFSWLVGCCLWIWWEPRVSNQFHDPAMCNSVWGPKVLIHAICRIWPFDFSRFFPRFLEFGNGSGTRQADLKKGPGRHDSMIHQLAMACKRRTRGEQFP